MHYDVFGNEFQPIHMQLLHREVSNGKAIFR